MNSIKELKDIDWTPYIERKSFIFYTTIFFKAYGSLMKKETGFGFTKEMCWFKEGYLAFYRSEKEMKQVLQYFLPYIKEEKPILGKWYKIGEIYAEKENKLLQTIPTTDTKYIVKNYQALIQELGYLFLYLTCIPWYILYAMEHGLSSEERQKYQHIQNLFQPFRKTTRHQLRPVLEKIWKTAAELSKREDFMYFSYFTTEELGHFFMKEKYPTEEKIGKRKEGCLFYKDEKDSPIFLYNPTLIKKIMKRLRYKATVEKESVEGIVASKGIVQGRVCIVNSIDDFYKFQEGDIIISINTNPTLMPVLEKCKAIVTNEGGLTCHAAIISRELNKPCIIGTKIATKVLKDGDLVEVDAEKGVVRKIQP